MTLEERVALLEAQVRMLKTANANLIARGSLGSVDDAGVEQRQTITGQYGEQLDGVTLWQPFGLSANCPPGGDVLFLSVGGSRDGAMAVCAQHPDFRPGGTEVGGTVLFDSYGNSIALGSGGITITTTGTFTVNAAGAGTIAASDVEVTSGSLTHNQTNVGDTHRHTDSAGLGSGTTSGPS